MSSGGGADAPTRKSPPTRPPSSSRASPVVADCEATVSSAPERSEQPGGPAARKYRHPAAAGSYTREMASTGQLSTALEYPPRSRPPDQPPQNAVVAQSERCSARCPRHSSHPVHQIGSTTGSARYHLLILGKVSTVNSPPALHYLRGRHAPAAKLTSGRVYHFFFPRVTSARTVGVRPGHRSWPPGGNREGDDQALSAVPS